MSDRFKLDREDAKKILKVALYSAASALVAGAISLLSKTEVPTTWIWLVPSVNTALVALKKLLDEPSDT